MYVLFTSYLSSIKMEFFPSFSGCWSYDSLKNFRRISPIVQTHLKEVYVSVCYYFIAIAVGVYLHILWNIGGLLTTFATFGCMSWSYEEPKMASLLLMAFPLLQGASLGPIMKLAIDLDLSILVSTFLGAAIAFACFSGAATLARRREFLYLGGLLSSGVSIFFWLHFASKIFGGDVALFQFKLYFGLLVYVGSIVLQTQLLILKILIEKFGSTGTEEEDYAEKLHSTTNKNST